MAEPGVHVALSGNRERSARPRIWPRCLARLPELGEPRPKFLVLRWRQGERRDRRIGFRSLDEKSHIRRTVYHEATRPEHGEARWRLLDQVLTNFLQDLVGVALAFEAIEEAHGF